MRLLVAFFSGCVCSSFSIRVWQRENQKNSFRMGNLSIGSRQKERRERKEETLDVYKSESIVARILCREQCTPFPWVKFNTFQSNFFRGRFLLFGDIIRLFCIFHSIFGKFSFLLPLNSI